MLAGYRPEAHGRGQVEGVRWEQANCAAAVALTGARLKDVRDAALIAVMSDAMLRVSECAALNVEHVDLETQTVLIARSKTDQDGQGAVSYLGEPTIVRLRAYCDAGAIHTGPLFRRITKGGRLRDQITARSIRAIVTARARQAGIPGRVSSHSLRIGAAQSLAQKGTSLVEMQQAGRWTSPTMPGRYVRKQVAAHGAVARLRYGG